MDVRQRNRKETPRWSPRGCVWLRAWVLAQSACAFISAAHSFKTNLTSSLSLHSAFSLPAKTWIKRLDLPRDTAQAKEALNWFVTVLTTEERFHPKAELVTLRFNSRYTKNFAGHRCAPMWERKKWLDWFISHPHIYRKTNCLPLSLPVPPFSIFLSP